MNQGDIQQEKTEKAEASVMCVSHKATKTNFVATVLRMWPALPYLGFGLLMAWSVLAYSGGVWLSDTETSGENISKLFVTSSITFALTALSAAFKSQFAMHLLNQKTFLLASGFIGAIGSMLLVASGPYYIGAIVGAEAYPVFILGGVFAGFSSAILLIKCAMLYSLLTPRRVLLYLSLSNLLLACVYYIIIGIPSWHPVAGGPPISGIVSIILILPVSAFIISLRQRVTHEGSDTYDAHDAHNMHEAHDTHEVGVASPLDLEPKFASVSINKLPAVFWKFLIMLLLFATVIFMVRAVTVELHPVDATLHGSGLVMFLRIIMALVFVVLSLGLGSRRLNFGKIYSLIAVATVVIIAILPMLGVLDVNWNLVVSAAIVLFEFTLWCLLIFVSYQRTTSPTLIIGLGYGVYMLGNTAGWLLGSSGLPRIIDGSMVSIFYLIVAGVVLLSTFLLFSERDLERLLTSEDNSGLSLDELMQEDIAWSAVAGENAASLVDGVVCSVVGGAVSLSDCNKCVRQSATRQQNEQTGLRRGYFMQQLEKLVQSKGLSQREAEVLRFLAMGRSSDFISEQLSISWNTARTHIHNVYVKLGVHSRQELIDMVDLLKKH